MLVIDIYKYIADKNILLRLPSKLNSAMCRYIPLPLPRLSVKSWKHTLEIRENPSFMTGRTWTFGVLYKTYN